jgi:hypothetical protein
MARPETATTMEGLKSALGILLHSQLRTSAILLEYIRVQGTTPRPDDSLEQLRRLFK